jgi:hypothetical protein
VAAVVMGSGLCGEAAQRAAGVLAALFFGTCLVMVHFVLPRREASRSVRREGWPCVSCGAIPEPGMEWAPPGVCGECEKNGEEWDGRNA